MPNTPTKIDSISIEIESNSTGAAAGIKSLADSLGELKKNGKVNTAVKNLNNLAPESFFAIFSTAVNSCFLLWINSFSAKSAIPVFTLIPRMFTTI